MSAVAKLPAEPPKLSAYLQQAIQTAKNPHPDAGSDLGRYPVAVRDEADRVLRHLNAFLQPATVEEWLAFIRPLGVLANAPANRQELVARAQQIAFALNDVPAAFLTPERQREVLRGTTFFPSIEFLTKVFERFTRPAREMRAALVRVVQAKPEQAPRAPSDPEAQQRIAAGLANLAAELRAKSQPAGPAERPAVKTAPISEGARLAMWEAEAARGNPTAPGIVAALRRRLEQGEA